MAPIIVIRQPMTQITMQRQRIQLVLQIVTMLRHRLLHRRPGIGATIFPQPVGLVVQQVVFALPAEHQVDKAFQHALHLMKIQRRTAGGKRIVTLHQGIELLRLQQPVNRQIELQLGLLVLRHQRRQRHTAVGERRVEQYPHPR